ncbi:hypothetical protein HYU95_04970 [Candidatus Daviesbacteria bacterium]|nr:hypothetical protein [Candidatus Daviesbacteria bacterium]
MLRINIYIPEDLNTKLNYAAKSKHKAKAQVIREAIQTGLDLTQPPINKGLIALIRMAEKTPARPNTPTDVSKNHDYYAWGGKKGK